MPTSNQDPVSQIKTAEDDSKKSIKKSSEDFEKDLKEHEAKLAKNVEDFEQNLKNEGLKKLDVVKKEAGELFKSKMATTESEKNKLVADATGKKSQAIDAAIALFSSYIKE